MIKLVEEHIRGTESVGLVFADTKAEVPATLTDLQVYIKDSAMPLGAATMIYTAYGDTAFVTSDGTVVWKGSVEPTPAGPVTVTIDNTVNCKNIYVNYIDGDGNATATKLTGETSYTITASEGVMSIFADGDMMTTSITTSADSLKYYEGGDSMEAGYIVALTGDTAITMVM